MKKSLIALTVLGAASGAALAQSSPPGQPTAGPSGFASNLPSTASSSSVTLYGIADIAIGKSAANGDQKWGAESNNVVTNANSRFGFTGKEDLGGGLWAGFRYEGNVNLANGAGSANVFSRSAYVQLGSNDFGAVKLGRAYTPSFDGVRFWELTDWANYSVIGNTYGYGAFPVPRSNAQIEYQSPTFGGLSTEIAYVTKANGGLLDSGVANQTDRWDLNVAYVNGPLSAAITANKEDHSGNSAYGNKTSYTLGGRYKFGTSFILAASYNHANAAQNWHGSGNGAFTYGRRYGFSLGGTALLGAFSVTLDLTRDTKNDIYGGKKYTNGLLEGRYALSKRTFLYADYLRLDGTNNYGLGIRHNF